MQFRGRDDHNRSGNCHGSSCSSMDFTVFEEYSSGTHFDSFCNSHIKIDHRMAAKVILIIYL